MIGRAAHTVAMRALAVLDPLGRRLVTISELHDALYAHHHDGGPTNGVKDAVATLRGLGFDLRLERHFALPPQSRRPSLSSARHRAIVAGIERGHVEVSDLAAHVGVSPGTLNIEISRMRARYGYVLGCVQGYRLAWTSFDPIPAKNERAAA